MLLRYFFLQSFVCSENGLARRRYSADASAGGVGMEKADGCVQEAESPSKGQITTRFKSLKPLS